MNTTTESDQYKQAFLFNLATECLQKLRVNYTTPFLKEAIRKAYNLTFETEYTDEQDQNKITVGDKEDPSNLAIVLLEALKRYHIKNEVTDMYIEQQGEIALLVLSSPDKKYNYQDLLTVKDVGVNNNMHSTKAIENLVILKTNEYTGEPGYVLNQKRETIYKTAIFLLSVLLLLAFGMAIYSGVKNYLIMQWVPSLSILLAGCFVCYHLYKLEKTNIYASKLLKKMCSGKKDFDCKEVISSPASKLFGMISHTDIGILYFSGMLSLYITTLLNNTFGNYLSFFFWATILPLPYTLFSLYYQLVVLKKICVLCLTIQSILWMQFACFIIQRSSINITNVSPEIIIHAGLAFGALCLLYFLFIENKKNDVYEKAAAFENFKFKNSTLFFEDSMQRQIKFIQDDFPVMIFLGNSAAKEKLSVILSLFCEPCSDKLNDLLRLADWFEDKIDIQITIKIDAPAAALIKELMIHIENGEQKKSILLLQHWYAFFKKEKEQGNYNPTAIIAKWNEYYPQKEWTEEIESRYKAHLNFYKNYPIPYTPLVQYNGKLLPGIYHDFELLSNRIEQGIGQEQNYEYA